MHLAVNQVSLSLLRTTPNSLEMHWDAVIEQVWRCNWRLRLSELRDALGGRDQASVEIHLQAMIE
jgi:hypothetical protein